MQCVGVLCTVLGPNSQRRRFLSASPTLSLMHESGVKEKMDIKDIQSNMDPGPLSATKEKKRD